MKTELNIMKTTFFVLFLLVSNLGFSKITNSYPTDSRSDSIDIIHTQINLSIVNFTSKIIAGNTQIKFKAKHANINKLNLDLLKLTIDSIHYLGQNLTTYSYNDTLIKIGFPQNISQVDTSTVIIFYHGVPITDSGTFGGFYFQNNIAYNIGVGFNANPHNFGRVWFPCFDNFTERFTLETNITTQANHKAFCGGVLLDTTMNSDGTITWKWYLNKTIPSYLASVAVGAYATIKKYFNGLNGTIPVEIGALAADTNLVKNSFVNLDECFNIFEDKFGPYMFPRMGYVMVPFTAGAMEHATNIAYPRAFIDGQTTYEAPLMAHELAHMWFGDLVTCKTQEDMWLNEGWASYCSFIFTEFNYSRADAEKDIKLNRDDVLHWANWKEGAYFPVSGVPHDYTYGEHSYLKGADVVNSLRGFLGDSLFFLSIKNYLQTKQFTACNSEDLRNSLQQFTGIDLTGFFNDWIFKGGFVDATIDSFSVVNLGNNNFENIVHLKQRLKGNSTYYNSFPIELTLVDNNWNKQEVSVNVCGNVCTTTFNSTIQPVLILVNEHEKIGLASIGVNSKINTIGTKNFDPAKLSLNVTQISDSCLINVVHHYAAPDGFKVPKPYRLSPQRYFSIEGIINPSFKATASFAYDGRSNLFTGNSFLDHQLINTTEDSLFLFYRKNARSDWEIFPKYTKFIGSSTDKLGSIRIDSLALGEYCLGIKDFTASNFNLQNTSNKEIKLFPNPSNEKITIEFEEILNGTCYYQIFDLMGKCVDKKTGTINNRISTISLNFLPAGTYFLNVDGYKTKRVVKF